MNKISLNQASCLMSILKSYEDHMINFDLSNLWQVCASLTPKQYGYILHLLDEHKWITIKKILNQQGLKDKPLDNKLKEFFGK